MTVITKRGGGHLALRQQCHEVVGQAAAEVHVTFHNEEAQRPEMAQRMAQGVRGWGGWGLAAASGGPGKGLSSPANDPPEPEMHVNPPLISPQGCMEALRRGSLLTPPISKLTRAGKIFDWVGKTREIGQFFLQNP